MAESRYQIIIRFLQNELSEKEKNELNTWRKATSENEQQLQEVKFLWEKAHLTSSALEISVDKKAALEKVQGKINQPKVVSMYRYLRIAASVAAVSLMVTFGFYLFNNEKPAGQLVEITPELQTEKVELEDGSIIYLNDDATFSYPKTFASNRREVTLKGEAFFEIAKDANRPFIIHTNHSDVEVLGTSFNIDTEFEQTEIAVATGKVKVKSISTGKSSMLIREQTATVTDESLTVFQTTNQNYLAWKTGVFKFEETPINQVVKDLNTFYGNKITLTKTNSDCLFSSTFNQQDLKNIVEIIQLSCDLQLNQKNKIYELY